MLIIAALLSLISLYVWLKGILSMKNHPDIDENTVVLPRFNAILGIICSLLFLAPVVYIFHGDDVGMYFCALVFILFWALGIFLVIGYINYRIEYNNDGFTHKNSFGKTTSAQYRELTAYRGETRDVKLFIGKDAITVDSFAINSQEFVELAKRRYKNQIRRC